jgi:lactate racemase
MIISAAFIDQDGATDAQVEARRGVARAAVPGPAYSTLVHGARWNAATLETVVIRFAPGDASGHRVMRITLEYGTTGLPVTIPAGNVTVLAPRFVPGLPDEQSAVVAALRAPRESPPLHACVEPHHRVAIVIPDITRPLPGDRLLPWVLAELAHVPAERVTIVIGTGSHRATTAQEIRSLVGASVAATYSVVDHDAFDAATLARAGVGLDGQEVFLSRAYVDADRRIVLGFIEPHLMAGFSGGYKGIFPGVADIASIMRYHDARMIGDPRSTWGSLEGNPTQERIRHDGALIPVDFCVNVTLNRRREITGVFCGKVAAAHEAGCAFSRETAMVACERPIPIVVTTNSGYPLDQNLYQSVKGMSAAAQVVADDGYIVTAARCNDGFPEHGNFKRLLFEHASPQSLLATIMAPGFSLFDQWQAQVLARILLRARVALHSELPADDVRRGHLEPVADVERAVAVELERIGRDAPVAVLPEGPMTIPYVA